jgi:hypothetical protein
VACFELAVELAGDVALEAAADVAVGFVFGLSAGDVGVISPDIFGPVELLRAMPLAGVASTR